MSLLLIIIATSLVRVSRKRYLSLQCWLESGIVAGEQAGQPSLGQGALRKCEAQLLLLIAHPPQKPFHLERAGSTDRYGYSPSHLLLGGS